MQFALILLLLFATGCRPAELVDAKKKSKDDTSSDAGDFEVFDDDSDLEVFDDDGIFNSEESDDDSMAKAKGDPRDYDDNTLQGDVNINGFKEEIRLYDAICYEDVRLLVVRSLDSGERDMLAMEVTMAHHKVHRRRPKP